MTARTKRGAGRSVDMDGNESDVSPAALKRRMRESEKRQQEAIESDPAYQAEQAAEKERQQRRERRREAARAGARRARRRAGRAKTSAARGTRKGARRAAKGFKRGARELQNPSGTIAGLLFGSITVAGLYVVLTRADAVSGVIGALARGVDWLLDPTRGVSFAPPSSIPPGES